MYTVKGDEEKGKIMFKKTQKKILEEFKKFEPYHKDLLPGTYRLNWYYKKILHDDSKQSKRLIQNIIHNYPKETMHLTLKDTIWYGLRRMGLSVFQWVVLNRFKVVLTHEGFDVKQGSLVMLMHDEDQVKVFNFKTNQVYTRIENADKLRKVEMVEEAIKHHFTTPVEAIHDDDGLVVETLIDYTPTQAWDYDDVVRVTTTLLHQFLDYSKALPPEKIAQRTTKAITATFLDHHKDAEMKRILQRWLDESLLPSVWPVVPFQGDFHYKNMLLSEDAVYLIDFEYFSKAPFIFILMRLMMEEYLHFGQTALFESYLNGTFDDDFDAIFKAYHLTFRSQDKGCYVMLFLMYLNMDDERFKEILERFNPFLKQYGFKRTRQLFQTLATRF